MNKAGMSCNDPAFLLCGFRQTQKVQGFLHFRRLPACYIICVSGEGHRTKPQDKEIGTHEGSA